VRRRRAQHGQEQHGFEKASRQDNPRGKGHFILGGGVGSGKSWGRG
jgi:hypothetical protein